MAPISHFVKMMASRRIGKLNTIFCSRWSKGWPKPNPTCDEFFHGSTNHIRKCGISSSPTLYKNVNKTGDELHNMYHQQLQELEVEQSELFGDGGDLNKSVSVDILDDSIDRDWLGASRMEEEHNMTEDERNEEREAIYNFSENEKQAWGNSSSGSYSTDRKHSAAYMDAINKAREAKALLDEEQNEREKKSVDQIAEQFKIVSSDKETRLEDNNDVFTHLNSTGDEVSMVDVGHKEVTRRIARAKSVVIFPPEVMDAFGLRMGSTENEVIGPKGPIFATARLAGIMGAKRTSDLIPLCHPLPLDKVHLDIKLEGNRAIIECECRVTHKTGVEMEALAGASIAALTIYDMVKAVSHRVRIEGTELVSKEGGKRNIS